MFSFICTLTRCSDWIPNHTFHLREAIDILNNFSEVNIFSGFYCSRWVDTSDGDAIFTCVLQFLTRWSDAFVTYCKSFDGLTDLSNVPGTYYSGTLVRNRKRDERAKSLESEIRTFRGWTLPKILMLYNVSPKGSVLKTHKVQNFPNPTECQQSVAKTCTPKHYTKLLTKFPWYLIDNDTYIKVDFEQIEYLTDKDKFVVDDRFKL